MRKNWIQPFQHDPIPALLAFGDPALEYFTRRDILEEDTGPPSILWDLLKVKKILMKQKADGSWPYPKRSGAHPTENYDLLQTYRNLRYLIETYDMNNSQEVVVKAIDFLLGCQSPEGDIRGIFGSQYAPHYTGGMLELIVKAGYGDDPRVHKAFHWFEKTRQDEGGWAWPLRTTKTNYMDAIESTNPIESDYTKPFSHALTMFVIRAHAAHTDYRNSPAGHQAGKLVKSRFFEADKYNDRRAVAYWFKFQYPFWWGNLLTALDSLSKMGFSSEDPDIKKGLEWFRENQLENGLWPTGYGKGENVDENQAWVSLAISRVSKRFQNQSKKNETDR